jgi:hypothetical protein
MDEIIYIGQTQLFLENVSEIINKAEQELDKDGSRFNIFSILSLSSSEVRLHSKLIAELLNPKGTHAFKSDFLELFLDSLNLHDELRWHNTIKNFNYALAEVRVEKPIGLINDSYTIGGNIDIEIDDKNGNRIIIENKIFAADQQNQLLRYSNSDKNALLLYLTLDGRPPSPESTGSQLEIGKDFYCISYKEHILHWLNQCFEIAENKPKVSVTISQYITIIKEYTHQSNWHKMSKEIEDLISSNKDFYNSIEEIIYSYNSLVRKAKEEFNNNLLSRLMAEFVPNDSAIWRTDNNIEIGYHLCNDESIGLFYGFSIRNNGDIVYDNEDEKFRSYSTFLKSIYEGINEEGWYIGWIYSEVFKGFTKENIFEFNKDLNLMNATIDEIINELKRLIRVIIKELKAKKSGISLVDDKFKE